MRGTVAAALKMAAAFRPLRRKAEKILVGVVLGLIILVIMPIITVTSVCRASFRNNSDEIRKAVIESLTEEQRARLQFVEDTMEAIRQTMAEAGHSAVQVKEAQVLAVLVLSEYAEEEGFVETLAGCFHEGQTDEELTAAVNGAFGTSFAAADFTKLMSGINRQLVEVARTQLGNVGGEPYWSWYGFGGRVEWCACFVSWCANECGYLDRGIVPKFSLCTDGVDWFRSQGQWLEGTGEPAAGMIIFYDWASDGMDGRADHVGIVEKVEGGTVYTIEGNVNDDCRACSYPVGHPEILGYGVPSL